LFKYILTSSVIKFAFSYKFFFLKLYFHLIFKKVDKQVIKYEEIKSASYYECPELNCKDSNNNPLYFFQDQFNKVIYLTRKNKRDILSIDYNYDSVYGYLNFSLIFTIFNDNNENDQNCVILDITKLPFYILEENKIEVDNVNLSSIKKNSLYFIIYLIYFILKHYNCKS